MASAPHPLDPHHDGSPTYVDGAGARLGDEVTLRVRVPHGADGSPGASRVVLRAVRDGEPAISNAEQVSEDAAGAWWEVGLRLVNRVTSYRFLVSRGPSDYRWLTATGVHARDVADAGDFRISTDHLLPDWVADEIVDNPDPALDRTARATMLDWLEDDVQHAMRTGWSGNLVVHAFARTAVAVGIGTEVVTPFFDSMRTDLDARTHTAESFDRYVYGSAEVVGLMCLRAFLAAPDAGPDGRAQYERLAPGARSLGAAFQKLNFVRDLSDDHDLLRRDYFPGLDVEAFCDADRDRILDDVDADLRAASAVVPDLPASSRRAVRAAHATFAELASRLRAAPAEEIRRTRVRVPAPVKLRLAVGSLREGRP